MSILDEIFTHKKLEVAAEKSGLAFDDLRIRAQDTPLPLDFIGALKDSRLKPAVIAEIKRASPSRGLIAPGLDAAATAVTYQSAGAAAISVLTDAKYFGGCQDDLLSVRAAVPGLPLLRKEFICDPYQIYQSRLAGADAILLIAACLSDGELAEFHDLAGQLGLTALVEIHNRQELERALRISPALIGINNRNLHTFQVSLDTTASLRKMIPWDICVVAESGIHTNEDIQWVRELGVDAVLVGEALVTAPDPGEKIRELLCA